MHPYCEWSVSHTLLLPYSHSLKEPGAKLAITHDEELYAVIEEV